MIILDFSQEEFDGGAIEEILDTVGISVSKSLIDQAIKKRDKPDSLTEIKSQVRDFALRFPLP